MRTVRLLLTALLALGLGWALAPRSAPPLYDGVGFPDEPYRFVDRPTGTRATPVPTVAVGQSHIYGRENYALTVNSAEVAPQVSVSLQVASLEVPAGAEVIQFVAKPEAMLPAPEGKYLWSNVYDLATTPATRLVPGRTATVTLRAATAQQPRPSIARYADGRWTVLRTTTVGRDLYTSEIADFGRYAVVGDEPLDRSLLGARAGRSSRSWIGIGVGLAVILAVVTLFVLGRWRRNRTRYRPATEPTGSSG